jgi:hypothetical protein
MYELSWKVGNAIHEIFYIKITQELKKYYKCVYTKILYVHRYTLTHYLYIYTSMRLEL